MAVPGFLLPGELPASPVVCWLPYAVYKYIPCVLLNHFIQYGARYDFSPNIAIAFVDVEVPNPICRIFSAGFAMSVHPSIRRNNSRNTEDIFKKFWVAEF